METYKQKIFKNNKLNKYIIKKNIFFTCMFIVQRESERHCWVK